MADKKQKSLIPKKDGRSSPRVLICIPVLLTGGTEMQTLNLIHVLMDAEYLVTVCCYYEYELAMVTRFESAGVRVILMNLQRSHSLWRLILVLRTLIKEIQPDIVHVQYVAPGLIPIITARLSEVRTIFATVHQPGRVYGLKAKLLLGFGASLCTAFFCVSQSAEESWFGDSQVFNPKDVNRSRKHFTVYNAVDVSRITKIVNSVDREHLRKSLGIDDSPVIGIVARVREEKGHAVLLEAMAEVLKTFPSTVLLAIGDGPDRSKLEKFTKDLGIERQIKWLGKKNAQEVFALYSVMDVVVVPSLFEGFGLSAAEAMAAKVPVVASNIDGLKEVVKHEETGYLFPLRDSHSLAMRLIQIIENPEEAVAMGKKGYVRVSKKFSLEIFAESMTGAYRHFSQGGISLPPK